MASTTRRYSKNEFAKRGDAIYENCIRTLLSADDEGKFAAIDVESGEFEIDSDQLISCDRLRARLPAAQIWMVRVGSRYVHRLGSRDMQRAMLSTV